MQHKWNKEIKAWADGAEIEWSFAGEIIGSWKIADTPDWDCEKYDFRIKPQPKEPQYLYVYKGQGYQYNFNEQHQPDSPYLGKYIGKIKLENDDE